MNNKQRDEFNLQIRKILKQVWCKSTQFSCKNEKVIHLIVKYLSN